MSSEASPAERASRGKAAREQVPRRDHGDWAPAPDRADPVGVLEEQAITRVPELLPIRYGRMAASPFAFFRGAAAVMASDLAPTPRSGVTTQLCGDAHLSNFGGFASPDRTVVFDLNDFDETLPGPWEWDVKRLAASIAVAGRERGFDRGGRDAAVACAIEAYRIAMSRFADMQNLDVWYSRIDPDRIAAQVQARARNRAAKEIERAVAKAQRKDRLRAFSRLTHRVDGELRLRSDPPVLVPISELLPDAGAAVVQDAVGAILNQYERSLRSDLRAVMASYRFVDLAHKVVGVGSVGTRAWVALLVGRDENDPLFLQIKEAQPSVLEAHLGRRRRHPNQGRRVVEGQRLMQAAGDILLGWVRATGPDGETRDFYVRQLWDWKLSADIEAFDLAGLQTYCRMCGWALAHAHARSGDRIAIAAYLGRGDAFDQALTRFAEAYADQNERDHAALVDAVRVGRVPAEAGV